MYVRILIGLCCIAALLTAFTYHLSSSIVSERHAFEQKVRQWASERTSMTVIDEVSEYRGKKSYAVAIGKNNVGTPVIAWMSDDMLLFDTLDKAVTKESVLTATQQGFPKAKTTNIVPGIDGLQRFWEVTLLDVDGRYHYVHYDLYTGHVLKSYAIQSIKRS